MLEAESLSQYIERLSALPPRKRLEEFRAISDPELRRQVVDALPAKIHSEMMGEAAADGLKRHLRDKAIRRRKPSQAA